MLPVVMCVDLLVQFEPPLVVVHSVEPLDAVEVVVDDVCIFVTILHILDIRVDWFETADSVCRVHDQFDHKLQRVAAWAPYLFVFIVLAHVKEVLNDLVDALVSPLVEVVSLKNLVLDFGEPHQVLQGKLVHRDGFTLQVVCPPIGAIDVLEATDRESILFSHTCDPYLEEVSVRVLQVHAFIPHRGCSLQVSWNASHCARIE